MKRAKTKGMYAKASKMMDEDGDAGRAMSTKHEKKKTGGRRYASKMRRTS